MLLGASSQEVGAVTDREGLAGLQEFPAVAQIIHNSAICWDQLPG